MPTLPQPGSVPTPSAAKPVAAAWAWSTSPGGERLDRNVAVKALPHELAGDTDRFMVIENWLQAR